MQQWRMDNAYEHGRMGCVMCLCVLLFCYKWACVSYADVLHYVNADGICLYITEEDEILYEDTIHAGFDIAFALLLQHVFMLLLFYFYFIFATSRRHSFSSHYYALYIRNVISKPWTKCKPFMNVCSSTCRRALCKTWIWQKWNKNQQQPKYITIKSPNIYTAKVIWINAYYIGWLRAGGEAL